LARSPWLAEGISCWAQTKEQSVSPASTSTVSPYTMATIYARLGDKDKAPEFLEKAYQARALELASSLKIDFQFDSLRSDRRFQNLLGRVGLAH
jgi:hypothetical protein